MDVLIVLMPLALGMGLLLAFFWSLRNRQFEDLDGAAWRGISDDD